MDNKGDMKQISIESEESGESISSSNKINIQSLLIILGIAIIISFILILYNKKRENDRLNHYDYIIVGSGLYGATFNYLAKKRGKKTLIIERRNVTGGNLYCPKVEGIYYHKYGPHVFHTDNKTIWDFVNSLVEFYPYTTQSIANAQNTLYNLPYTMWTFNQMWGVSSPEQAKMKLEEQKFKDEIYNLEDQAKSIIGKDFYDKFIKENIKKEWGRFCPNLPPFIIPDLPIRFIYDTDYFYTDRYQGIPVGCYNALFDVLLNDTEISLNVDYIPNKERYDAAADQIIFTGRIDEYYNYTYGPLDYRTVRWVDEIKNVANYQGSAVIHYPDLNINYTRVVEHKHLDPYNKDVQKKKKTIVSYEYYEPWNEAKECLYPLNDEKNNNIYIKYKDLADQEKKVIFGGRLATYKYYDMKDIIEEVFRQFGM